MQELKTASISDNENIQNLAKIEGHIDYLVVEFNRMGEEARDQIYSFLFSLVFL
jgi:hypothetical protein